ncbi:MAG: HPr family phosphocarrier protein [Pseudomonadota bacterium]
MNERANTDDWQCADLPISNKRGLHARASAKFVQVSEKFDADITVEKDGTKVGGRSIMGLMLLAASMGSSVRVCVRGAEREAAMIAIRDLVENRFGEDD